MSAPYESTLLYPYRVDLSSTTLPRCLEHAFIDAITSLVISSRPSLMSLWILLLGLESFKLYSDLDRKSQGITSSLVAGLNDRSPAGTPAKLIAELLYRWEFKIKRYTVTDIIDAVKLLSWLRGRECVKPDHLIRAHHYARGANTLQVQKM